VSEDILPWTITKAQARVLVEFAKDRSEPWAITFQPRFEEKGKPKSRVLASDGFTLAILSGIALTSEEEFGVPLSCLQALYRATPAKGHIRFGAKDKDILFSVHRPSGLYTLLFEGSCRRDTEAKLLETNISKFTKPLPLTRYERMLDDGPAGLQAKYLRRVEIMAASLKGQPYRPAEWHIPKKEYHPITFVFREQSRGPEVWRAILMPFRI
jgi:hypothetical protein